MLPRLRNANPTTNLFDALFNDDFFRFSILNDINIKNPLYDIIENDGDYVVEIALAGVKKEDITINLDDNRLLITAERKEAEDKSYNRKQTFYGKYEKSFILPDSIKTDDIHASFEDGILKVIIPKTEMIKTTKQIEIK